MKASSLMASLLLTSSPAHTASDTSATIGSGKTSGTELVNLDAASSDSERIYNQKCGVCHAAGKMYPGYTRLKARGMQQPTLAERIDLNKDFVKYIARKGLGSMPMFTPIQLSDSDLEAIATWLTEKST